MKYTKYLTKQKGNVLLKKVESGVFKKYDDGFPKANNKGNHPTDIEADQIKIYPDIEYQTFKGFGGALTESSACALFALPKKEQEKVLNAYYGKNGINYNVARTHIGSCDFSLSPYSYIKEGDKKLKTFSLERDNENIYPLIQKVLERKGKLYIFSSPWSPVPFMKTNNDYRGGQLKKEYYSTWAKYIAKYINEYRKKGVKSSAVTVQNELRHAQIWESCNYTKEDELLFAKKYLEKALKKYKVKIYVYDHCGERLVDRAKYAFDNSTVDGIAFHWYSGEYFDELKIVNKLYPDKDIIMSEGCVGVKAKTFSQVKAEENWNIAFFYSNMISSYIQNGLTAFCDWNICLNEKFAPYHFRENRGANAYAPVICDSLSGKAIFTPTYYAIGQYSKFVEQNAKVIASSCGHENIKVVAFKNSDNSIVLVVHNNGNTKKNAIINIDNKLAKIVIEAKSISTFIIK
ncbi:MAG: glucosylceramidase [Clostridia bacterium]|nr:glucosylceramidase [Clostridia bacterium]